MKNLAPWLCWALPLIGLNPALRAGELRTVAWYTDVDLAWKATQQKGQPMLVFVTSDHCLFCNKMKHDTYLHPAVATVLESSFVPLTVDGRDGSPLIKELKVTSYPMTFIISPQAVVLERITGYVSPESLMARLEKARGASRTAQRH